MDIEKKLIEIIRKTVNSSVDIDLIQKDTDLITIGVDSIIFIRIVVEIENAFQFEFGNDNLIFDNFRTIRNILSFITNKISLECVD